MNPIWVRESPKQRAQCLSDRATCRVLHGRYQRTFFAGSEIALAFKMTHHYSARVARKTEKPSNVVLSFGSGRERTFRQNFASVSTPRVDDAPAPDCANLIAEGGDQSISDSKGVWSFSLILRKSEGKAWRLHAGSSVGAFLGVTNEVTSYKTTRV